MAAARGGRFILFKTDITESKKLEISRQAEATWVELDPSQMEISQDFKDTWRWFLHRQVGEIIAETHTGKASPALATYLKLLGLGGQSWYEKAFSVFPKLEKARIKIKTMHEWLSAEFEGDFKPGASSSIPASSVTEKLDAYLCRLHFKKPIYICLDELEVFFHTADQYRRDLRMVRDLLFAAAHFNSLCRSRGVKLNCYAGVRTEVLDALGSDGQEVSRLVGDCGTSVTWHNEKRSMDHQLFHMIRRKIWSSEAASKLPLTKDPIAHYFPITVAGKQLDEFLLDQSFYRPRDLIIRLKTAQELHPLSGTFSSAVLSQTEKAYSVKMWEEVAYELSATYSQAEVGAIEGLFIGKKSTFSKADISERLRAAVTTNPTIAALYYKRGVPTLLDDLYRVGAIGNYFPVEQSAVQRWIFRGDPRLDQEQRMGLHSALFKMFAARR